MKLPAREEQEPSADCADAALNVVVRGDAVLVLMPGGATVAMSAGEAEVSARRLLDAADIARGRMPTAVGADLRDCE